MGYFCRNAQEEALKGIERQMYISNVFFSRET